MSKRFNKITKYNELNIPDTTLDPGEGTSKGTQELSLSNWCEDEKVDLLLALKAHGSKDLQAIAAKVPTKTVKEIENAIIFYKSNLGSVVNEEKKDKMYVKFKEKSLHDCLTYWINLLRKDIPENELQTNLPKAIQIIGECEKIPSTYQTAGVDFRKIYLAIADLLKGEQPRQLNAPEMSVMKLLVHETLREAKETLQQVNVDMKCWMNPKDAVLPRSSLTEDAEIAAFELLISQKNCNPFGIDASKLKY